MEETTKDEVLEQKVEVNANVKPEKVLTKRVWLNGFKLFGKIAFAVIFSLFYFISMMFFISPKVDAKIFKFFGAKKAEEACYIRVYDKSQSKADLYNLILIESELENYDKELYYLNILMNDEDYEEFYLKLDESAFETITLDNIETLVYVCNTNSYLINQKVKCMYHLGFDSVISPTIRNYLKTNLEGDFAFESSFLTYVELVYSDDSLSSKEKADRVNTAYNAVDDLLQQRLVYLNTFNSAVNITVKDQIISQHNIVNIRKAKYMIDVINESGNVGVSKLDYEKALKTYNQLIENVIELV
ncbi:MAG: hypothetical protein IJA23_03470 [Clostridia bacterium]|nr:hypothetical protein [Clostridia bacterium]